MKLDTSLILNGVLLAFSLGLLGYGVLLFARRQSTPAPQKARRIARIAVGPMALGVVIILWLGQLHPEKRLLSYLMALPMFVLTLRFAWDVFHEPTEADALDAFAHDREHCGRCGYAVTGNVTGMCSECGWTFPTGPLPAEEPDWSAWWRKWRIEYIRRYIWHLSSYVGLGLFCFFLAVVLWQRENTVGAVLIALLGVHLSINAVRVIDYLRRRRKAATRPDPSLPPQPGSNSVVLAPCQPPNTPSQANLLS